MVELYKNQIACRGAEALFYSFAKCSKLENIDLSHNSIGQRGARAVTRGLSTQSKMACSLRSLDLSSNPIGEDVSLALGEALLRCKKLQTVELHGNALSDEAISYSRNVVRVPENLRYHMDQMGKDFVAGPRARREMCIHRV